MISGIINIAILAQVIGSNGVGILAVFMSTSILISSFFSTKSSDLILTYVPKYDSYADKKERDQVIYYAYTIDFFTAFFGYVVILLVICFVDFLLEIPKNLEILFLIFSLTVIFNPLSELNEAIIRFRSIYKSFLISTLILSLLKILISFMIYFSTASLVIVVILQFTLTIIECFLKTYVALNGFIKISLKMFWAGFKKNISNDSILYFQGYSFGRNFLKQISRNLDIYLLIKLTGSYSEVGLYRIAKQLLNYSQLPLNGLSNAIHPILSKLWYNEKKKELKKLIIHLIIGLTFISIIVYFIVFFIGDYFILLFFGERFILAGKLFTILFISLIINMMLLPLFRLPIIIGDAKPSFYSVLYATLLQYFMFFLIVPKYYSLGAAWSYLVYVFTWAISLIPSIIKIYKNYLKSI